MLIYDHTTDEYRPLQLHQASQDGDTWEVIMAHVETGAEIALQITIPAAEPSNRWQALYHAYRQLGLDINKRPGFTNPWIFKSASKLHLTFHDNQYLIDPCGDCEFAADNFSRCENQCYETAGHDEIMDMAKRMESTIRNIYASQGYYSALAFILNAGLCQPHSQAAAEACLDGMIDG